MHLGAIFPQTEIGADPAAVRDFAQAAEAMGYEDQLGALGDRKYGVRGITVAEVYRPAVILGRIAAGRIHPGFDAQYGGVRMKRQPVGPCCQRYGNQLKLHAAIGQRSHNRLT